MKCFKPYFRKFYGMNNAVPLPCGNCPACRYNQSKEWSLRIQLESRYYNVDEIFFVTLTYHDLDIPDNYSLDPNALSAFMKRFRKHLSYPIRFFGCGEYGERFSRPHYHLVLFGVKEADLKYIGYHRGENCESYHAWKSGFVQVERPRSAESVSAYVAQYVTKKQKWQSYGLRHAPYHRQSLGLGKRFLEELPFYSPFIIMNGYQRYLGKYLRSKLAEMFNIKEQIAEFGKAFLDAQMSEILSKFKDLSKEYQNLGKYVRGYFKEKLSYLEYYSGEFELQKAKLKLQKVRLDL